MKLKLFMNVESNSAEGLVSYKKLYLIYLRYSVIFLIKSIPFQNEELWQIAYSHQDLRAVDYQKMWRFHKILSVWNEYCFDIELTLSEMTIW